MNALATFTNSFASFSPWRFSVTKHEPFAVDAKFARTSNGLLSTHGLNVSINGAHILKNVSVSIPKNKITCIIGPSGCGKSTLLRTFNRLNDRVEGLKVSGKVNLGNDNILSADSAKLTEMRRNIGLVPQRPCPLPMSIYDNVAYGCRIHGIRSRWKLDAIVEHYLKAVGLWEEVKDRLHSSAAKLSGGQQQRLCLARSLAVEPSYLLADESTSALDPIASKKVEDLFRELKNDYSIVMVTHTLRQARRLADYVIFMYLGEVIESGEAKQVFERPENELTQKYLAGAFS